MTQVSKPFRWRKPKFFATYVAAGMFCTALAGLGFALRFDMYACGLIILTPLLVAGDWDRIYTRLGLMGLFFFCSALLFPLPWFTRQPPPWPSLSDYGIIRAACLLAIVWASVMQLPRRLVFTGFLSGFASVALIVAVGVYLHSAVPITGKEPDFWEYYTILAAVVVLGLGVWWPVDVAAKRLAFDD